jgi:hypothetical protein
MCVERCVERKVDAVCGERRKRRKIMERYILRGESAP